MIPISRFCFHISLRPWGGSNTLSHFKALQIWPCIHRKFTLRTDSDKLSSCCMIKKWRWTGNFTYLTNSGFACHNMEYQKMSSKHMYLTDINKGHRDGLLDELLRNIRTSCSSGSRAELLGNTTPRLGSPLSGRCWLHPHSLRTKIFLISSGFLDFFSKSPPPLPPLLTPPSSLLTTVPGSCKVVLLLYFIFLIFPALSPLPMPGSAKYCIVSTLQVFFTYMHTSVWAWGHVWYWDPAGPVQWRGQWVQPPRTACPLEGTCTWRSYCRTTEQWKR